MSQTTEKHSRFLRFGAWVAELVLVFVGVYAAFWLNNYQQHRQDAERRDQILAALEQQLREGIESGKTKRRADRAESRPGHFVLLRSGHEEITKAVRDISGSSTSNREIC